jgi:hypothetical protein
MYLIIWVISASLLEIRLERLLSAVASRLPPILEPFAWRQIGNALDPARLAVIDPGTASADVSTHAGRGSKDR